jgi:hypothetical protein
MTGGQWRVLGILVAILALETWTSPNTRKVFEDVGKGKAPWNDAPGIGGVILGFGLAGVVLIAVAAWQEGLATAIAVLFLLLVLIARGDAIGPAVQRATDKLMELSGKNPQAGSQGK